MTSRQALDFICLVCSNTYLIFVILFTHARFSNKKISHPQIPKITPKKSNNLQFLHLIQKILHLTDFCTWAPPVVPATNIRFAPKETWINELSHGPMGAGHQDVAKTYTACVGCHHNDSPPCHVG